MNLLKNTLFSVIAIQLLVFAQLSFVKYSNSSSYANILRGDLFSSEPSSQGKLPLILQPTLFSPKTEILTTSITTQLQKEIKELISSQLSNNYLTLLYDHRIHDNKCMSLELNAKKLLGLKYVWGATGPHNFDCSGFTQKVYKVTGIKIPRNSRAQAKVGEYIKYEELQKGDMVFFDTNRKKTGRVNHVGIYLEDGKFIHASSGNKKIVITSFDKKRYYKSRFLWGRRVIKENIKHLYLDYSKKNLSQNLRNI
jgi:cell wall-associated NlpC family hydrolase